MFTDTHIHLYAKEYEKDLEKVLENAHKNQVLRYFLPNINTSSLSKSIALTEQNPALFFPMIGLHPCEVEADFEEILTNFKAIMQKQKKNFFKAIGEIGLDFYHDKSFEKEQKLAFEKQIDWAIEEKLPICLHVRKALDQTLEILQNPNYKNQKAVFHCFGGSAEEVKKIRKINDYYFGIGGVVTFKNAKLADTIKTIGLERILLETDGPYLAPEPFRGKRNEPAYIAIIAQKIAEILEISVEKVAQQTEKNVNYFFGS